jgi:hypothetical protein
MDNDFPGFAEDYDYYDGDRELDDYDYDDVEADADTLSSAGWGTDEDYGHFTDYDGI